MKASSPLGVIVTFMLALPACQWLAGIDDRKPAGPPGSGGGLGNPDGPAGSGGAVGVDGGESRDTAVVGIDLGTGGVTTSGGSEGRDAGTGGVISFDGGSATGGRTGTPDASNRGGTTSIGGRTSTGGIGGSGGLVGKGGAMSTGGVVGSGGTSVAGGSGGNADAGGQGGQCEGILRTCNGDLSHVGTRDFEIEFTITTSTAQRSEVLNQRAVCAHGFFWDIQLVDGTLQIEVDDNDQHYTSCRGTTLVNDGKPHRVVSRRSGGKLATYVDCVLDSMCACAVDLSATLSPLRTTLAGCPAPPPDLVGALSDVCVSSDKPDSGMGGAGGTGGTTNPDASIHTDGAVAGCSGASVFDDFSSTSLDPTKWSTNTSIPLGTPSVVQTGGHVDITNRGNLNTVDQFVPSAGGVRVTGKWTFDPTAAADDFLQVLTRTDGVPQGEFGENQAGIECYARMATSDVGITGWGTTVSNPTSSESFLINRGDSLAFEMTDDGSLVTCAFVNLTSGLRGRVSAISSFAPAANRISLHNREFEGETRRSFIDDLAIESGFVNRPTHHYLFEEASGTTAYDLPGTTDGTLGAGASRVDAIRGSGISFAGTNDGYVDLGTVGSALGTSDFTIAFWFKIADTTRLMDLLGDRVNMDFGNFVQIRMNAAGSIGFELCQDVSGTNYQTVDSAPGYDDSQWHHLAVRRQGTTLAMFIDGSLAVANTRTTGTRTDLSNGAPLRLGSSAIAPDFDGRTMGTFDDVRVYSSALGDCDIAVIASRP